jgi:hypothetical protein
MQWLQPTLIWCTFCFSCEMKALAKLTQKWKGLLRRILLPGEWNRVRFYGLYWWCNWARLPASSHVIIFLLPLISNAYYSPLIIWNLKIPRQTHCIIETIPFHNLIMHFLFSLHAIIQLRLMWHPYKTKKFIPSRPSLYK